MKKIPTTSHFLILHNIRSLLNVGAIFRSADAFGVDKIYLCGYTAYPAHRQMPKIAKTALGAQNYIPWEYTYQTIRLIKKLKKDGVKIVVLENNVANASPLSALKTTFPLALILGNEIQGVNKKILSLADEVIFIPMHGKKESLNVACAASIALYILNEK